MESSYFSIGKMSRESGDYIVYEWKDGVPEKIFENSGKHYRGLKKDRQKIGEHLQKSGHTIDKVFGHQCIIHTRKKSTAVR
ncbi:hypothetical protein IOC57_24325 [Bacillus sp. SD075]|uniref:hypothetical protein n=1 Tax=Bacillus sp. SD075 TaxID=2781732 RepID=UPI001A9669F3|nr:hypothetical protein [Bacillus sp. SD075]MBO1000847.1 hypothetical protein [Bacillus sp. SD075]